MNINQIWYRSGLKLQSSFFNWFFIRVKPVIDAFLYYIFFKKPFKLSLSLPEALEATSLLHLRNNKNKETYVFQWYSRYVHVKNKETIRFPMVFQVFAYKNIKNYTYSNGFLCFWIPQKCWRRWSSVSEGLRGWKTWKTIGKRIVLNVLL